MLNKSIFTLAAIWLFALAGAVHGSEKDPSPPPWAPTSHYAPKTIEGWKVLVNKDLPTSHAQLCGQVLALLRAQLAEVARRVPAPALARLRRVTIWVEENEPHHPGMVYHPDPRWLREHGMNPDKARGVEIANARNFLSWSLDQPAMTLHELAHAYMDQFLSQEDKDQIRAAYQKAIDARRYEEVLYIRGGAKRAYAANNPMEYFAEASEAFFGTNDFYPFVSAELRQHDPDFHRLLARLWGKPEQTKRRAPPSPATPAATSPKP